MSRVRAVSMIRKEIRTCAYPRFKYYSASETIFVDGFYVE